MLSTYIATVSIYGSEAASTVALGLVGILLALAMLAFPVLLGFAVKTRRRALWVPALITGALSLITFIYFMVTWGFIAI